MSMYEPIYNWGKAIVLVVLGMIVAADCQSRTKPPAEVTTCRDTVHMVSAGPNTDPGQFKMVCENGSLLATWHQMDGWHLAVQCLCPADHIPEAFNGAPHPPKK